MKHEQPHTNQCSTIVFTLRRETQYLWLGTKKRHSLSICIFEKILFLIGSTQKKINFASFFESRVSGILFLYELMIAMQTLTAPLSRK